MKINLISRITKSFIFLSFILFSWVSCQENKSDTIEKSQESDVVNFEANDEVMNNAIAKAKETFHVFEEHFKNHKDNQKYFYSIKQGFSTPDQGAEHIWIDILSKDEKGYVGIVANEPYSTTAVVYADTIIIDQDKLSDWMIVDAENATAQGGYTIRVIRDQMSPKEQQEFDSNYGLTFE